MKLLIFIVFMWASVCPMTDVNSSKVAGKYISKSKVNLKKQHIHGDVEIELKEDFSFEYHKSLSCLASENSTGTWKAVEGGIILNSKYTPKDTTPLKNSAIYESQQTSSDSISVKVCDEKGETLFGASCVFYFKNELVGGGYTDQKGKFSFNKIDSDSVLISYFPLQNASIQLDSTSDNVFVIYLQESDFYPSPWYRYFKDEFWIYKNGKLYDPQNQGNEFYKGYYKKHKPKS